MRHYGLLKKVLIREVVPATGCTEVGAVALATAWAAQALGSSTDHMEEIRIEVDDSTYKNALGAGIPGTDETGLDFAAAMGASSAKRVQQGLQILENPEKEAIEKARDLLAKEKVRVMRVSDSKEILILARILEGKNEAVAVIRGSHDHVVGVEKNGKPYERAPGAEEDSWSLVEQVKKLKYRTIVKFAKEVDVAELPILRQAMEMNVHFAQEARKNIPSLKIGKAMGRHVGGEPTGKGSPTRPQFITAIAVEARMRGLDLPVMACAGSGNQGLVATIPVVETAKVVGASDENLLRALALSYLTTIYIKTFTGLLSPVCGCGVAAAVGAGCGMVYLLGGDVSQIEAQITNMVGTMVGIICDGAKSGCALKALMAVGLAVDSVYVSLEGVRIPSTEGVVGDYLLDTLKNLQRIVETGMPAMDAALIELMEEKKPPKKRYH